MVRRLPFFARAKKGASAQSMGQQTMNGLIKQALCGTINRADADAYCQTKGISLSELWNSMALSIAQSFQNGDIPFRDADQAANAIWFQMIEDAAHHGDGFELPEPAFAIYEAFDSGEYGHGDNEDPVLKYTRPAIEEILKKAQ